MILDSVCVQNFNYLMVAWVKMPLLLVLKWDMSLFVHIDNKKYILILGKGPKHGLDDTRLTAEAQYTINLLRSNRKFCLSLYYNGSNSFLFANATKIYQSKVKGSEIKKYPLCLGNISKGFYAVNMRKAGLNGYVYDFSVDYNAIAVDDILDIRKYLSKKHDIK